MCFKYFYISCWSTFDLEITKIPLDFTSNIFTISGRVEHACSINILSNLACWGKDYSGETIVPSQIKHVNYVTTGI